MQMASKELEIKEDAKVAEECKALMATEEELGGKWYESASAADGKI